MEKEAKKLRIKLSALRVNAGLTQEQVAAKLKICKATLIKWEKNETYPPINKLNELCELYGCQFDDIDIPLK
jgi:transcriptional regulator with XRE-family HTH domain